MSEVEGQSIGFDSLVIELGLIKQDLKQLTDEIYLILE